MGFAVKVYKSENRLQFDSITEILCNEHELIGFSDDDKMYLIKRLKAYNFIVQENESAFLMTKENEFFLINALVGDFTLTLYTSAGLSGIFEALMLGSELTDTGEYISLDVNNHEWLNVEN